jgi:pimeloyl-ACP methyl ester carboxylesterase
MTRKLVELAEPGPGDTVLDADLRRIRGPDRAAGGKHDRFVPLGLAEAASARLGWPLHVIDDAHHAPTSSGPTRLWMAARRAWREVEGPGA